MAADLRMMAKRLKMLEDQRAQGWDAHWQDLVNYLLPRRGRWLQKGDRPNLGDSRSGAIIDGLATRSLTMLAAGMQGGLTSPARPWFRLALSDPSLEGSGPVRSSAYLVIIRPDRQESGLPNPASEAFICPLRIDSRLA